MRSVFVYLQDVTEPEITHFLTTTYPFQVGPPWVMEKNGDPVLYIDFYHDLNVEAEVEEWFALMDHFGGEPAVIVVADVSGRHSGTEEVCSFVSTFLRAYSGVAQDDYTQHLWSGDEVEKGARVEGHPFFDTLGWYHAEPLHELGR